MTLFPEPSTRRCKDMPGNIHSIETFGTVDGPGIRYVVFLQGCPLRCLYCHNPDTWESKTAKSMSADEILEDFSSYAAYLKSGGITCTGGEPLLQIDFVTELFGKAKARGIHTCLDTSGITFRRDNPEMLKAFDALLSVTDLVLLDIKHIDEEKHRRLSGSSNRNVLDFAGYLSDIRKDVWIRHVVVPHISDDPKDLRDLGYFLGGLRNIKALEILPYHDMGKSKYQALGLAYPLEDTKPLSYEDAAEAKERVLGGIKERLLEDKKNLVP